MYMKKDYDAEPTDYQPGVRCIFYIVHSWKNVDKVVVAFAVLTYPKCDFMTKMLTSIVIQH